MIFVKHFKLSIMKTKLTLIWIGIIALNFSCKNDMITSEENRTIPKDWIPAYTKLSRSTNVEDRTNYCFCVEKERPMENYMDKTTYLFMDDENNVFPKHFGGQLASKEEIRIMLTDTSEQVKREYMELCQITPGDVIFQSCDYAYNDLLRLWHQIETILAAENNPDVFGAFIRVDKNRISVVFYGEKDETKIQQFKSEIVDSPMLMFEFIEELIKKSNAKSVSLKAKSPVNKLQDRSIITGEHFFVEDYHEGRVGFKGYLQYPKSNGYEQGFITAAHIFEYDNLGFSLYKDGDIDITDADNYFATSVYINPKYDVAFCKLRSGYTLYTSHTPEIVSLNKYDPTDIFVHIGEQKVSAFAYPSENDTAVCYFIDKAALKPGDSGALVTDSDKNIVGIVLSIAKNDPKCFYIAQAHKFWKGLDLKLKL